MSPTSILTSQRLDNVIIVTALPLSSQLSRFSSRLNNTSEGEEQRLNLFLHFQEATVVSLKSCD